MCYDQPRGIKLASGVTARGLAGLCKTPSQCISRKARWAQLLQILGSARGFGLTEPKAVATEAEGSFGDLVK